MGGGYPCLEGSANIMQQGGGTAEISAMNPDFQLLIFVQNLWQFVFISLLYILLGQKRILLPSHLLFQIFF